MTRNTQANAEETTLPLFYKAPMLLRFEEHCDVGLMPGNGFGFAREAVAIPLSNGEFATAMRHYPIVFAMDQQASPIALVAIRKDHNLFVERDGSWTAKSYVPAYARRYPFIGTDTPDGAQFLSIDRTSERFVASAKDHAKAQRLFDDTGKPTTVAQNAMAFCHAFQTDYVNTVAFGKALLEAKVLEPYHADFRLPDGSLHKVDGFYAVNEQKFRTLPAETVTDWHGNGWLGLIVLHLASLQSLQNLLDLNAQRATERKALA